MSHEFQPALSLPTPPKHAREPPPPTAQALTDGITIPRPSDFEQKSYAAHNRHRDQHNARPLEWDYGLTEGAKAWAAEMATSGIFAHSPDSSNVGENLARFGGSYDDVATTIVDAWYAENDKYDYDQAVYQMDTAHFTQLVWKDTRKMGMAMAKGGDGYTYVVARYDPPGNVTGWFKGNVLPRK